MFVRDTTMVVKRLRSVQGLALTSLLAACVGGAEAKTAPSDVRPRAASASPSPAPTVDPDEPDEPPAATPTPPEPEPIRLPRVECVRTQEDGYRRGKRVPITAVMMDGRRIEISTADAFMAMATAAAADGVPLPLHSGFRSMAEQQYFYDCYKTCSCNECIRAAKPGYSNHQSGRAVDIGMWEGVHAWLVANANRFGFRATVRSEPWHWEYRKRRSHRWPEVCPEPPPAE